jgi:pimeloyl-ACP methyl ester carboxylesterase
MQGHPPRNLATVTRHNAMRLRPRRAGEHFTSMKLDPCWFSVPDAQALRTQAASLRCPTALIFGRRSHMGAGGWGGSKEPAAAAEHLRSLFPDASLTTLHPLSAGHFLLEEAPLELRDVLLERLGAWTSAGALDCGDSERKPETLGLRVLGPPPPPRARPSAAAIDRMLQEDL